jgi:hypothetical protein
MVCGKKIARAKKAAKLTTTKTRPLGVSERPRVAAFSPRGFIPLPVPTGGSDFLPEPSAIFGYRCIPCLHHLLAFALQMEPNTRPHFFQCCGVPATIVASLHGGT